jgi:hypothetical protein
MIQQTENFYGIRNFYETAVLLGMELDSGGNAIINSEEEKENM